MNAPNVSLKGLDLRAEIEAGLPEPPGGGSVEEVDIYPDFHEHMLSIVVHGIGASAIARRLLGR